MTEELLSGWGRTAPTRAELVAPASLQDVVRELEREANRGLIARGLGRAYGDAAQNAGGTVLDMTALSSVEMLDVEAGKVTAGAGTSLHDLLQLIVPRGWFVPVTPGTRYVTLGGALACDVHGKNHHRDGSFSAYVEEFDVVLPGGEERRVVRGDALFEATAGGMGLTGVITRVTLRLLPIETSAIRATTERAPHLAALMERMSEEDASHRYSVAWIDCLKRGRQTGRGIILWGDHAERRELPARLARDPLGFAAAPRLGVPDVIPSGLLGKQAAGLFNELCYRRAPRSPAVAVQPLGQFFHPLDTVRDWNRAYGPLGFVQYQAVVPFAAEEAVRELLERLSTAGASSFLAVLKRLGRQDGLLSFPMEGWTLALDIPAGVPRLHAVLDELDQLVVEAGGRVYLAKDARVRPELLERMYPRLPEWLALRRKLDPDGMLQSDLARRLELA